MAKDVPVIPLWSEPTSATVRSTIRGFEPMLSIPALERGELVARALAAAIAVSLLAVSGAGGADAQTPKRGGTVVFGRSFEPAMHQPAGADAAALIR